MNKCDLFNQISKGVWQTICRNHARGNRLNEEGITRQTVLDTIQNYTEVHKSFNVFAQKAKNEVQTGGDLEIYFQKEDSRFHRILLQAKLMEIDGRFEHLDRDSGSTGRKQYDTLNYFAKKVGSEAYYLMYNGCENYSYKGIDCAGEFDEDQFGCAIMDVGDIKEHCENNSTGKLGSASNPVPFGKPWRKLSCCKSKVVDGNKLYTMNEIDMDAYFSNLFTSLEHIDFVTPSSIIDEMNLRDDNDTIHGGGWNPTARIIVTRNPMKMTRKGKLDF